MSDVYLMLGLGLEECSQTRDYLYSGRPMQLVRYDADGPVAESDADQQIQYLLDQEDNSPALLQVQETTCHPWQVFEADWNYR